MANTTKEISMGKLLQKAFTKRVSDAREEELQESSRTVRLALAAKRREWPDDDLIDEADEEDIEGAAKLLVGAVRYGLDTFNECDCDVGDGWQPCSYGTSRAMQLLIALGLVAPVWRDPDGQEDTLFELVWGNFR